MRLCLNRRAEASHSARRAAKYAEQALAIASAASSSPDKDSPSAPIIIRNASAATTATMVGNGSGAADLLEAKEQVTAAAAAAAAAAEVHLQPPEVDVESGGGGDAISTGTLGRAVRQILRSSAAGVTVEGGGEEARPMLEEVDSSAGSSGVCTQESSRVTSASHSRNTSTGNCQLKMFPPKNANYYYVNLCFRFQQARLCHRGGGGGGGGRGEAPAGVIVKGPRRKGQELAKLTRLPPRGRKKNTQKSFFIYAEKSKNTIQRPPHRPSIELRLWGEQDSDYDLI